MNAPRIAVVIPCYRVQSKILDVVARIQADVDAIYVVDDACPLRVGDLVEREVRDPRVRVVRLLGNSVLSLLAKFSSGYWNIMDPTNGFIAMHATIFRLLPHAKIAERFFFESDMLFRVNLLRAHVVDVPIRAHYGGEFSNLRIARVILPFIWYHLRNAAKRIAY